MSAPTPAAVLAGMMRADAACPRITFYDDTPGATAGERIELSARVLSNWVNKAANALQEEWDVEPGSTVRLALPAHWRGLYWALAVWSVGGCAVLDDATDVDVTVADDPVALGAGRPGVLVTLAALARSATVPVPAGSLDEAAELSTYADQFTPTQPDPRDPALHAGGEVTAYGSVVPRASWPAGVRVHTTSADLQQLLRDALAAWALDGSVVLSRGPGPDVLPGRLQSEGVTLAV